MHQAVGQKWKARPPVTMKAAIQIEGVADAPGRSERFISSFIRARGMGARYHSALARPCSSA